MHVISVEIIETECPVNVYDLSIEGEHSFVLANGVVAHNSIQCIGRSGLEWTVPEHKPIHHKHIFLLPPIHWSCRSIMTPVVRNGGPSTVETFEQFLRRRGEAFQDEVLGPGRARLWRDGKLTSTRDLFEAATGRPLTLEELGA